MAKLELREISERLSGSSSSQSVISSHIGYLEQMGKGWRATVALYECSTDRLVSTHWLDGRELISREIDLPVETLPTRLVRKFFHHSMVARNLGKKLVLNLIFRNSPFYTADEIDREALDPLVPLNDWKSCICFPLSDSEDVIAMLILASKKKNAFPSRAVGDILPLNSVAAMALAQHLYRAEKGRLEERIKSGGTDANEELQTQLDALEEEKTTLASQIDDQARTISDLLESMSHLDKDSGQYREELERLQTAIFALEEQSSAATEHLADAYSELTHANFQVSEMQTTNAFMKAVGDVLAQEHDDQDLPITLLCWFCEYFGVERFSLMVPDPRNETLGIAFARGISEEIVRRVRVRIGQGIAGWVAHNRKALLVQSKDEDHVAHTGQDRYNSDSYLSVPLVHNNYLYGVVNLSNKTDGKIFNEHDLDRAAFLSTFIAMSYDRAATPGKVAARM